jgi:hypothetical protein
VSGGMFYNISVPAVADDPPLNDEWHATTFVDYLETAIRGGLPWIGALPRTLVANFTAHQWHRELTKSLERTREGHVSCRCERAGPPA